jgi:L-iditol 2-dehydrogenase
LKALVLQEYGKLEYRDVPMPPIGPEDVLVEVKACGICGSDVHGVDGSTGRRIPPIIMGHEASGVVAKVGEAIRGWNVGDRVTFDSTTSCGTCWFCRRGNVNLCENRRVFGVSCPEFHQDGAYAEYVAIPQNALYKLPEQVSFVQAALVEPLSIAVHAVGLAPLVLGDNALVVGAGPIGLMSVQVLKVAGCNEVIAVDVDDERLALAQKLGATTTLNPKTVDVPAEVRELTSGRGVDVVIEAVGTAATVDSAIANVRKGGWVILVGNLSETVQFPVLSVVTKEVAVRGSCIAAGEYPVCLDMIARGAVNVDCLVSAVAPLSEGKQWFDRLHNREPGLIKVVLTP